MQSGGESVILIDVISSLIVRLFLFAACAFLLVIEGACAEPLPSPKASPLPELRGSYPFGSVVSRDNVEQYRELLPSWLFERVASGAWSIEVARELGFGWRLDDEWERASASVATSRITAGASPAVQWFAQRGWAYGRLPVAGEGKGDAIASRLLWNVQSAFAGSAWVGAEVAFIAALAGGERTRYTADWERILPPVGAAQQIPQLFRERLRLVEPAVLVGMEWLTFRFLGDEEDLLWAHSLAINKTRQLTGSNRADPLLTSGLALDDLLGWNGKVELVQPVMLGTINQVAPFWPFLVPMERDAATGCTKVRPTNEVLQRSDGLWNVHTRRFPDGAAWLPTAAVYVPREMYVIELQPRDPYAEYGRQVLYVDRASQLPVYKMVYDRGGNLWKVIVSAWGLATSADHQRKIPFPLLTFIEDVRSQDHTLVEINRFSTCPALPSDRSVSDFESRHLGPTPTPTAEPLQVPEIAQ